MNKISYKDKKLYLVLLLLLPTLTFAQQFDRQVDSMKRVFYIQDSTRKAAFQPDTTGVNFVKSSFQMLYHTPKEAMPNQQRLSVQGVKYMNGRSLFFFLKGRLNAPISLSQTSQLDIIFNDNTDLVLNFNDQASSQSTGMQFISFLKFGFSLTDATYQLLSTKSVSSV